MYDIVAAVDQDEGRAVNQAESIVDLPGREEIRVTLLHVFTDNPEGATVGQLASVRAATKRFEDAGVEVSLVGESGDPVERILAVANERDADAISICGRKRSPTGKVLFGSVTQALLLESTLPILVAGREE